MIQNIENFKALHDLTPDNILKPLTVSHKGEDEAIALLKGRIIIMFQYPIAFLGDIGPSLSHRQNFLACKKLSQNL